MAAVGLLGLMCTLRVPMVRLAMCRLPICRPALERRALPCCCTGSEGCAELRVRTEARYRDEGGLAPGALGAATEVTGAERAMRLLFSMTDTQDGGWALQGGQPCVARENGSCCRYSFDVLIALGSATVNTPSQPLVVDSRTCFLLLLLLCDL